MWMRPEKYCFHSNCLWWLLQNKADWTSLESPQIPHYWNRIFLYTHILHYEAFVELFSWGGCASATAEVAVIHSNSILIFGELQIKSTIQNCGPIMKDKWAFSKSRSTRLNIVDGMLHTGYHAILENIYDLIFATSIRSFVPHSLFYPHAPIPLPSIVFTVPAAEGWRWIKNVPA